MPEYVEHLDGKIIQKYYSVDPSVVEGKSVVEISRDVYNSLTKFHKVADGQVVLMTQEEQDALLAEEAQAATDNLLAAADRLDISLADALIALVKRINVRIPNNPITKAEIVQQIKEDKGLI